MLRFAGAIAAVLLVPAASSEAFTVDQLPLEFDARLLTNAEKSFLQTGLAFANDYNGLIDGAWGSGTQRALERYEVSNGRSDFVTNADVLFLALETYDLLNNTAGSGSMTPPSICLSWCRPSGLSLARRPKTS